MKTQIVNLIPELKRLVQTERKITAEIVEMIKEIDRLKLYLDHGHTSIFSFLTKEVGYTPSSAIRRINAARILHEIPELKEDLKTGSINLSQASMLVEAVRKKQKDSPSEKIEKAVKQELLLKVKSLDLVLTEKVIAQELDLEVKTYDKKSFQKDESVRAEVTFTKEQWADLERVKELISHQNSNPSMADLFSFLSKFYLDKKDPLRKKGLLRRNESKTNEEKRKVTSVPDASTQQPLEVDILEADIIGTNISRSVSNKVRQQIFKRDQFCQWEDSRTKQKCGSRFQMQIDHKQAVSNGGQSNVENLQVLCGVHNRLKYKMGS